ncbi:MAG: hypothetical protein J6M43_04505 [Neisseriaceae bacterium]|nr:hypothetical protein [Neisseriaceae bacterium]
MSKMSELTNRLEKSAERNNKFFSKFILPCIFIVTLVFFVTLVCFKFLNIQVPFWFVGVGIICGLLALPLFIILSVMLGYEIWLYYRLGRELKLTTEDAYEKALIQFYRLHNVKQNISENPNADLMDLMWFANLRCHYWKTDRKEKSIEKNYNNFGEQFSIKVNIEFIDKSGKENEK